MSVITSSKSHDEIDNLLFPRMDLGVVVLCCDKCAKTCLACADCRFDRDGCRMVTIRQAQAHLLRQSYPGSASGRA